MSFLSSAWAWCMSASGQASLAVIFGCLFAVSEALSLIPSVKSNGVFQWIVNGIKWVLAKLGKPVS